MEKTRNKKQNFRTHIKGFFGIILTLVILIGISYASKQVQAQEPSNETMDSAIPLELGQSTSCIFNDKCYEAHYFKFTVPENIGNQWITFTVTNYTDGNIDTYLLDSQGNTLSEKEYLNSQNTCIFENRTSGADTWLDEKNILTPGKTYYIKTYRSYREGSVSVSVNSTKDDNWGTYNKASSIKIGKWKNGKLEKDDDIDCFSVKLPKNNRRYRFYISSDNYIKAAFVNGNRTLLKEININANKTDNSYIAIGKGQIIYIRTQVADREKVSNANYSIKVSLQKKDISKLTLNIFKKNSNKITGTTLANSTIKVKIFKKIYTVKSNKTGKFTVRLKNKLKTGDKIKISVSKSGYKTRTKTYKVR